MSVAPDREQIPAQPRESATAKQTQYPLAGVRILELGTLLAGPFVGRLLGDFGAEIIKVEAPGAGDPLRQWGRLRYRDRALWWPVQSRNKKLITLDLRTERGQELCRQLAATSDVLVENFRPGTIERWGLSPERLWEDNPRLIIVRISGYGQTGPYSSRAGFASVGEAMGGLRYLNGYPGQAPPRIGISIGDSLAALFASLGTMIGLYWRDVRGGRGQVVDASILESCFALLEGVIPEYAKLGAVREPTGTVLEHVAPSNVYRTHDGKWMVVAANNDNLWRRLCDAIGHPELLGDPRFRTHQGRGNHMTEIDAVIGDWVGAREAAEVESILNAAGVACGPVYSIADIFQDAHFQAREMLLRMDDPDLGEVIGPGIVPRLSETPGGVENTGGWELGRDNDDIYGRVLGLSDDDLASLRAEGVI